ncbi:uncharacterized protein FTOL_12665 [Fusarium torulosum]|uniref:Uncharacterized protein n=1 Tax=Fusarium torulosum TaxID=33205 RepID=A0AAE8MM45_9HYPO|nr:uncharacterized protein FTOL_12665 [Fusarium torulosum]
MPVKHRLFNLHYAFYVSPLREPKQSPVRSSPPITKHAEMEIDEKKICSHSQIWKVPASNELDERKTTVDLALTATCYMPARTNRKEPLSTAGDHSPAPTSL